METKAKISIWVSILGIVGLVVLMVFTQGCNLLPIDISGNKGGSSEPTGSFVLTVNEPMTPLILLPGGDNVVDYYVITVSPTTLPDPPSVQQVSAPPPAEGVLFENLKEDTYTIDIGGFTVGDELITQGFDVIFIAANTQETTTIQMEILPGTGTVEIDLTITPGLVPYDLVIGQWYDGTDWTVSPWAQASAGVWDLDKTAAAGYHLSVWELFSAGYETIKVAGAAEAVYVRQDRLTAGLYDLNESNIGPAVQEGSSIVVIWEVLQPVQTYFTDGITEVYLGEEFTLTTTTDSLLPIELHHWYLDGVALDPQVDSPDLTMTAPLEETIINFSKVGYVGSIITSASKIVSFVEVPPAITTITFTDPTEPTYLNGSQTGSFPLAVEVLDQNSDPMPDGTTIYWQITSVDPEFHDVTELEFYTSVTTSGGSANTFILWDTIGNQHYGNVEAAGDPDFLGVVAVSPEIGVGNF